MSQVVVSLRLYPTWNSTKLYDISRRNYNVHVPVRGQIHHFYLSMIDPTPVHRCEPVTKIDANQSQKSLRTPLRRNGVHQPWFIGFIGLIKILWFNKWCWSADKPSAALDPYIPTWLTTSPANQRPANFWYFFLKTLKGNCEKCCIFRLNWWGPTSNLKLPFFDSSHTNNHLYIIYQSVMEMLTYFHNVRVTQ